MMKMMTVTSQNGWAVIGVMEQKSGTPGNENAVSEDLQKRKLTDELHYQLW